VNPASDVSDAGLFFIVDDVRQIYLPFFAVLTALVIEENIDRDIK
jgi:hypothetical protein